jgi:hypothetical protein
MEWLGDEINTDEYGFYPIDLTANIVDSTSKAIGFAAHSANGRRRHQA